MDSDDLDKETTDPRKDIIATQSAALSIEVEKAARTVSTYVPPAGRSKRRARAQSDKRFAVRKNFLEPQRSDPNGFEHIIGDSDLMSINFLDRGRRAAAAVCRIKVPSDGGAWYGTGFLVGPRLLLTNHHVLSNPDDGLKPYTVNEMRSRHIQTTIAAIEEETGLDFSAVRRFDAQGTLEATRQTRWINDINDVVI